MGYLTTVFWLWGLGFRFFFSMFSSWVGLTQTFSFRTQTQPKLDWVKKMKPTQTRNPIQPNLYISDWVLELGVHPYSITSPLNKYKQVLLTNPKKKEKTIKFFKQIKRKIRLSITSSLNKSKEYTVNKKTSQQVHRKVLNTLQEWRLFIAFKDSIFYLMQLKI